MLTAACANKEENQKNGPEKRFAKSNLLISFRKGRRDRPLKEVLRLRGNY
jgi:hypothetical protein